MTSLTPFDILSDEIVGNILLFCDFKSAVEFTKGTSRGLRQRFLCNEKWEFLWKIIYDRHGFCRPTEETNKNGFCDFLTSCHQRRRLLANLVGRSSQHKNRSRKRGLKRGHPFNIPNRCFHFLPIVPVLEEEEEDDENFALQLDPPPVFYECDSFVLTGCGVSPEVILLDPFDGSLRVLKNCLHHASSSKDNEAMILETLQVSSRMMAKDRYKSWRLKDSVDSDSDGDGVMTEPSSSLGPQLLPLSHSQCLLQSDDYFHLDVSNYFPDHNDRPLASSLEEFDMHYLGLETKPILTQSEFGEVHLLGSMICFGRSICSLDQEDIVCTEFTTWVRPNRGSDYQERRICRVPQAVHVVDLDACHGRLFISFPKDSCPSPHAANTIYCYPLLEWDGDESSNVGPNHYFPDHCVEIACKNEVSFLAVDATGEKLLVATKRRLLEIWQISKAAPIKRLQLLDLRSILRSCVAKFIKRHSKTFRMDDMRDKLPSTRSENDTEGAATSTDDVTEHTNFLTLQRQPDLPQFRAPIRSIFVAKHLSLEQSGFVTFHHAFGEASSLLLWKMEPKTAEWRIVTLINLPLSSRRSPRIFYDGNRLIVFGEDPIGVIILIYQVTNLEYPAFDETIGEGSGGVYNLSSPAQVKFANRIRHVALGGIDSFDLLQMACNERFLVVNTRTGNLLGSSPIAEGLLVIDLFDQM